MHSTRLCERPSDPRCIHGLRVLFPSSMSAVASADLRGRRRKDYAYWQTHQTRWCAQSTENELLQNVLTDPCCRADNDQYAHMNNTAAYALFDSVINTFLIAHCELAPSSSPAIGLVVASHAAYFAPLSFPTRLAVGLRVPALGAHSATYEVAVFDEDADTPAVVGGYTHVFVDRETRKSVLLPEAIRRGLQTIAVHSSGPKAKM
jgi:acyl-CoA thioester hydrolase